MSETNNSQPVSKPKTLVGKVISLPFSLIGILFASLLLSVIIECLGIYLLWPEQTWHHAESMFYAELEGLSQTFTKSLLLSEPVQVANQALAYTHDWIFIKTGLVEQLNNIITPKSSDSLRKLSFREYLTFATTEAQTYLMAAGYTILTFIVRLFVLILSMPLIFLAIFVGFVDGLVKRDLRRFVAGHESGFIYHRARAFLAPAIALPWVIYLALPFSISPLLIMLPCALLAGIVMNITAASFKKYL